MCSHVIRSLDLGSAFLIRSLMVYHRGTRKRRIMREKKSKIQCVESQQPILHVHPRSIPSIHASKCMRCNAWRESKTTACKEALKTIQNEKEQQSEDPLSPVPVQFKSIRLTIANNPSLTKPMAASHVEEKVEGYRITLVPEKKQRNPVHI